MKENSLLKMPSFLYGTWSSVRQKAVREGQRCGRYYQKHGTFPSPRELLEVQPGETVAAHCNYDFVRTRPVWRLHMLAETIVQVTDTVNDWHVSDLYHAFLRETPWGALYFAITYHGPFDVRTFSLRIKALLRFWDSYQSVRYSYTSRAFLVSDPISFDELVLLALGWAMRAWCPEGGASHQAQLEIAAERMERATKEDCIEAILRELAALQLPRQLKRPEVVGAPSYWRERLPTLHPDLFDRVSAAYTGNVLELMHHWDRQLDLQ